MITFIDDHRRVYGVELICRVLPITPSTYYKHVARRADPGLVPPRARRDRMLKDEIRCVWKENFQVYGADKVWKQLRREGIIVARGMIERLMKLNGPAWRGVVRGKTVRTTVSDVVFVPAPT
ncbi:helix-turn-helix protein [Paraburkholderia sp. BL6665CI2N2]|nr:helix-turn-helix protein [Paraburkholderia sp. BL25I1N1]TDY17159.1 helix-turn-helix protein [Paraburkholderia sp. BL6665CI2N2]